VLRTPKIKLTLVKTLFNFVITRLIIKNIMKKVLFLAVVVFTVEANAQNYLISFAGTGASNTVSNVLVENLMTGTTHTLNGNDILHLTGTTGINSPENKQSSEIKIYPNPMTEYSTMEVNTPVAGDAVITVFDMTGRQLSQTQGYLNKSRQKFRLSGFENGLFLINIRGNNYQISEKLLCAGQSIGIINIEKISDNIQLTDREESELDYKGAKGTVDMPYTTGDRLKFTGISGDYSTVKIDMPTLDKTITFNFLACTDGDGNNYPIVQIAQQIWMAANLKATKYLNGDLIGTTTPATKDINSESMPKYQWAHGGNESNVAVYGRLYTGYAVRTATNGGKNVCPLGWHVPTDYDWITLTNNLGGIIVAGNKLKESGTTHWYINKDATNESGFTALPSGSRDGDFSSFVGLGFDGQWWSETEEITDYAWCLEAHFGGGNVYWNGGYEKYGLSVRCIKD
jgi:uncharacterized protein (TIGR02145 family)